MPPIINASGISKKFGLKPLFQNISFTVSEGDESFSQTFTQAQWNQAQTNGTVLKFSHSFKSGSNVSFDVDFSSIENVPDTAGVGTSTIQKNIDLQVTATNSAGESVTRDGLQSVGNGKVSNGENSFSFSSGRSRCFGSSSSLATWSRNAATTSAQASRTS